MLVIVARMGLSDLHEDPNNARLHDRRNLDAIANSLKKFGQVEPIVVQKSSKKVIAGNARLRVLREAGATEVDVVEVDLDDVDAAALSLALNRTAELGSWNDDALGRTLASLKTEGWSTDGIGWTEEEVRALSPFGVDADRTGSLPVGVQELPNELPCEWRCPKCGYEWSGKTA